MPQVEGLAREYYKATKGRKALVWSRGLRDMCGLGEELSDEEVAAQECRNAQAYRLTILRARANARKDHVMAGLLAVCNATHGDLRSCTGFLSLYGVAYRIEPPDHIRRLFDEDKQPDSPVSIMLKPQAK